MGWLPRCLPRCPNLGQDCKAQDAALAQTITKAVAREMAKAHAHYQAILNERGTATLQTSLKVSSGANGFKVMDPFNWTKDKSTRDGNCGQKRLDSPLMPWRETQRKLRFLTSIMDQWRGNGTHWVMEKQQNPHQPVSI